MKDEDHGSMIHSFIHPAQHSVACLEVAADGLDFATIHEGAHCFLPHTSIKARDFHSKEQLKFSCSFLIL